MAFQEKREEIRFQNVGRTNILTFHFKLVITIFAQKKFYILFSTKFTELRLMLSDFVLI